MGKGNSDGKDIDAHLRRAFQEIESDPLPEHLLGLLDELRQKDGADGAADASTRPGSPARTDTDDG